VRIARVPALLLLVAAGVLAMVQPANAATPQPDVAYLSTAHQLNLTIIEAAHTATAKGRTSCVRRVAAQLERDHRKLSAQELDVATRLSILLPTAPTTAQRRQLDGLAAKAGTTAYDGAWLALQRQAHQQYLALVEGELPISASPAVEALADGAKPVIQMHQRAVSGTCRVETNTPVVPTGDGGQQAAANLARTRAALILMGIGVVLLLVGKAISLKRRVIGIAALAAGLVMMFGGQPTNTGKVPDAGKSSTDREAAVPPVRLKLPGVLEASVQPVATGGNGQLQVPKSSSDVGWWAAGAAPGSVGGTVLLAGHVDTAKGLGVFAALSEVPVGAKVAVTGGDGGEHWYRIVARRTYKQEALPADLFHGAAKPRLALVTCTGSYDRTAHRYSENLVLYGVPVD
jgi:predicted outer membrane protein